MEGVEGDEDEGEAGEDEEDGTATDNDHGFHAMLSTIRGFRSQTIRRCSWPEVHALSTDIVSAASSRPICTDESPGRNVPLLSRRQLLLEDFATSKQADEDDHVPKYL